MDLETIDRPNEYKCRLNSGRINEFYWDTPYYRNDTIV